MGKWLVLAVGIALLGLINYTIHSRETLRQEGRIVLLELAPVDPRSLMQGDYVALRFQVAEALGRDADDTEQPDGLLVLQLDEQQLGRFLRLDDGRPLARDEVRLRYRVRAGQVKLATNAFFFQEGQGRHYEQARYGAFRVAGDGDALLTGLRGADFSPLGAPSQ
ncbi:MAG: GDYXXLXY domain-containing protein [Azovibrio sp.]|nr:GDYXXLXY domain-containing protein [Azovibrio sp.]